MSTVFTCIHVLSWKYVPWHFIMDGLWVGMYAFSNIEKKLFVFPLPTTGPYSRYFLYFIAFWKFLTLSCTFILTGQIINIFRIWKKNNTGTYIPTISFYSCIKYQEKDNIFNVAVCAIHGTCVYTFCNCRMTEFVSCN